MDVFFVIFLMSASLITLYRLFLPLFTSSAQTRLQCKSDILDILHIKKKKDISLRLSAVLLLNHYKSMLKMCFPVNCVFR